MDIKNTVSLKPIFWHQGQFLQPQHFQHIDRFNQSQLSSFARIANPYFYGVVLLEINETALGNDVFEIENGEFLMPDGTYVDYPDNAVIPSRSFTSVWTDRTKPLSVYIGLRKEKHDGDNVTVVPNLNNLGEITTRYFTTAHAEDIPNLQQAGPTAEVKYLTTSLRIFWGSEMEEAQDYDLMPVAEIISDGGTSKLSSVYIPPCLHIASSDVLLKTLKEIRDELSGRIRQLEDYKLPVGASAGTFVDGRLVNLRMVILHLSQQVPMLFHYVDTPTLHPWEIYALLRQLIGGISSLSDQINFLGETKQGEKLYPEYNHYELGECFSRVYKAVTRLLNEITVSSETIIRFNKVTSGRFEAEIPAVLFGDHEVYLSVMTGIDFEKKWETFLKFAKVASTGMVDTYAERSLPGLNMEYLSVQPEGVPRRPNTSYLRLNRKNPIWEEIKTEKNITLLWDDAPSDLKVDLIVV